MQFCIQLYVNIWKIIPYLQPNPNRLKAKNINSFIFITIIIKQLMLMILIVFYACFFLRKKRKGFLYINILLYRVIV